MVVQWGGRGRSLPVIGWKPRSFFRNERRLFCHRASVVEKLCFKDVSRVWRSLNSMNDPSWENKKTKQKKTPHQNCSCFPQHTVHDLSLSASSSSLWPKTRGIICFAFSHLGFFYVWNYRFKGCSARQIYFHAAIVEQYDFAASYVYVTILLVCVKMQTLLMCKYMTELRSFASVVKLSLMNLCKIFFVDGFCREGQNVKAAKCL